MGSLTGRVFLAASLLLATASFALPQPAAELVIRHGSLISMASDRPEVVPLKGIVVDGGRITRIIRADSKDALPPAARTVDATSLYVLPGLIDAHVHFRTWFPQIFLEYGVTTLMDTGPSGGPADQDSNTWITGQRRAFNEGTARGPSLYVTGMKLGGSDDEVEKHTWRMASMAEVEEKLKLLADLKTDGLKVEAYLPLEFRKRIVEEGERRGVPVVGHSKDARASMSVGMRFIEHMFPIAFALSGNPAALERGNEYLMDLSRAPALIDEMVARKVYLNPTLLGGFGSVSERRRQFSEEDAQLLAQPPFQVVPAERRERIPKAYLRSEGLAPEKWKNLQESYRKVQQFLRDFHAKGGRILAASDATTDSMPGLATHREMQLIADAGVPAYAALLGATRYPAELMHKQNLIGTVEEGKQADLLLLGANPVQDIAATRNIHYVIRKGKVEKWPAQGKVSER